MYNEYENHAFISYAHIDNQPANKGWISEFNSDLQQLLSEKLGENVKIWRDNKLDGADKFNEKIAIELKKTAILISVVTPRYVKSKSCAKEYQEFYEYVNGELKEGAGKKVRILKVIKTPVDEGEIPPEMNEALGYEFFRIDENGRPKEFRKVFGDAAGQEYFSRVDDMAYDIKKIIVDIINEAGDDVSENDISEIIHSKANIKSIYVAHTSYDLTGERDQIVRELKDHGYDVFPNTSLPLIEKEFEEEVIKNLNECQMAIHLIGKSYGGILDGPSQKSSIELQNAITATKSKIASLPRIIWIAKDMQNVDERQQELIKHLNEDADAHCNAEVIEGTVEDLKFAVLDKIEQINQPAAHEPPVEQMANKKVYLICDAKDMQLKLTFPLRKYLKEQNIHVTVPLFTGEPSAIRQHQDENLTTCDAVLIFYGSGDEAWKSSKISELKKINTLKRSQPLQAIDMFYAEPITFEKEMDIEEGESNIINGLQGFSPGILQEFINKLRNPIKHEPATK